ncbi:uncharacterized protein [Cicer arietinum]|uniref:Proline-rich protein 4 n=1 Tax=Cicer arietinum TaxID=3827 RepID=A0A1S2YN51_CICAR|nr:proline-rich protein 4 [Cicer arietinum]
MSWFFTILFLTLTFGTNLSESNHDKYNKKKLLPSSFVVGTIYCDTCSQQAFSQESHFISGASIAIECKMEKTKQIFYEEVKTNEHGEFKVKLPFIVKKHVKRIKGCNFKLISSNEPHCSIASTSTSFSLSLKKKMQKEHIFSAGIFSFKPIKNPKFCNKKYSIPNPKKQNLVKNLEKSKLFSMKKLVHDQEDFFFFPPNPLFPPPLIPNPFQPPPLIPNPFSPPPLIPNPFQPPSPPLIPNPFQPPSPPPLFPNPFQPPPSSPPPLIPNPFQPPPSSPPPLFPFPPIAIPGLTPSPPPPPPPRSIFPFPFPPLFPPPHSPGSPPTSSMDSSP